MGTVNIDSVGVGDWNPAWNTYRVTCQGSVITDSITMIDAGTSGNWHYPQSDTSYFSAGTGPGTVVVNGPAVNKEEIAEIVRKALADKDSTRERQKMRGLYECFVVDYKAGEIVFEKRLVADDENKARLKAAVLAKIDDPDEYDIIVRKIGDVRCRKQVQEVKVVSN